MNRTAEISPSTFSRHEWSDKDAFLVRAWNAEELGLLLVAISMIQEDWSQRTFGKDDVLGPEPALHHLRSEVEETLAAPTDVEEYADCFLLLMDAARRAGFSIERLILAAQLKQMKCLKRKWGEPDANGVRRHIEEEVAP